MQTIVPLSSTRTQVPVSQIQPPTPTSQIQEIYTPGSQPSLPDSLKRLRGSTIENQKQAIENNIEKHKKFGK